MTAKTFLFRDERKIFHDQHEFNLFKEEKKEITKALTAIRLENQTDDRTLKQMKHFNSKRDKEHKDMEEKKQANEDEILSLNKDIEKLTLERDEYERRLKDKDLLRNQQNKTQNLSAVSNSVDIDIKIAESRIEELKGKKDQL